MHSTDVSETAPFRLEPEAGTEPKGAVLLLHGFTGSPWEVRPLAEALAARGYHAYVPQLPGHGTSPEAMLYVSHVDWERAAERALVSLERFERVFVAGLSMGALLSMLLAARFPDRVRALVLMAPALRLRSRGARLLSALSVLERHPFDSIWVKKLGSDLEDTELRRAAPLLPKYPAARLRDVFQLQTLASKAASSVRCPTLVLVADHDHVIDVPLACALPRRLKDARLVRLQRGFHLMPRDVDRARVATEVGIFLEQHG